MTYSTLLNRFDRRFQKQVSRLQWDEGAAACNNLEPDPCDRVMLAAPPYPACTPDQPRCSTCRRRGASEPARHAFELGHTAASGAVAGAPKPGRRWSLERLLALRRRVNGFNLTFVSFADGEPFESTRRKLVSSAVSVLRADRVIQWDRASLGATPWGGRNKLPRRVSSPGCSTCGWKPHILLDAMASLRDGDFVLYADSSRYLLKGFQVSALPLLNVLAADAAGSLEPPLRAFGFVPGLRLRQRNNARINWRTGPVRRPYSDSPLSRCDLCDLLERMGLCGAPGTALAEACCDEYLHSPHVQNSFSLWQKNRLTEHFLTTWRELHADA